MKCVISFGTDGWRSTMDTDFTVQNLAIAAQGIANYLKKHNYDKNGIIIGYDTRKNSRIYAEEVASVLLGNGIKVLLTDTDTPIPVLTFGISDQKLDGGVMITASHNPPEYNGIKFIPYYASPALPDITDPIMDEIKKIWENPTIKKESLETAEKNNQLKQINIKQRYIDNVLNKINSDIMKDAGLNVIFDALYGTARTYLPELLKILGINVIVLHDQIDPSFGGASPNPSKENLQEISKIVIDKGLNLGLACDGDADRLGIIDNRGNFLHANILFALFFDYELSQGKLGDAVRTVGTTHLIDRIAKAYNRTVFETPVGAKYIAQYMREKNLLIGGEESGGVIFRGHITEKDGIFANLKILEMITYYKKPLSEITAELFKKYGDISFTLVNFSCKDENKEKAMKNIVKILPKTVSGKKVIKTTELDGFKFVLEDDSWLLIRPSGTEPLLRLYGEANTEKELKEILDEGKILLEQALK
ncbi:MAG: phosphoglucomutase/phosphomannomutase family protein [Candidatus Helarchaeota archaeon]|nr:phosphoglucomutase/phosphomannomutase family protein [Candidatus Helarchaeota archaeon]